MTDPEDKELPKHRTALLIFISVMTGLAFVTVIASAALVAWMAYKFKSDDPAAAAVEQALIVQTIQVDLGMILGFIIVALGVVMAWVAIQAPFTISAGGTDGTKRISVESVSPGIVLTIGGMLIIWQALYLPMNYTKSEEGGTRKLIRPHAIDLEPVKE
jgi:hypothetical protein